MKEASLSEILLQRMNEQSEHLNLSESAAVLTFLPPFLLKEVASNEFLELPCQFEEFSTLEELRTKYPEANVKNGHPHEVFRFLSEDKEAFLNFGVQGYALLRKADSKQVLAKTRMSLWLNYALSPELWGPEGKWSRFHEQLHKQLSEQKLLEGQTYPGYYPLKADARPWGNYPLTGDTFGGCFTLILPWTFSLSDLRKLSAFINEENSCLS